MQARRLPLSHPDRKITTADHLHTLALCGAYKLARTQHLQTERMVKGVMIALNDHVTLHEDGTADVASQFGTQTYHVNGECACPDAPHAPKGWCKHRWAKALARKAQLWLMAAAVSCMDGEEGAVCPDCGHTTVIEAPIWGKQGQSFAWYRVCRMVLAVGEERYACGWREVCHD